MTDIMERPSRPSHASQAGSPWNIAQTLWISIGCEAEPARLPADPRHARSVIDAHDTYQHSDLLRFHRRIDRDKGSPARTRGRWGARLPHLRGHQDEHLRWDGCLFLLYAIQNDVESGSDLLFLSGRQRGRVRIPRESALAIDGPARLAPLPSFTSFLRRRMTLNAHGDQGSVLIPAYAGILLANPHC